MSESGSGGGGDSGSAGGGFDSGSSFDSGFDGTPDAYGSTDAATPWGIDQPPGSPLWMHHQHLHGAHRRRQTLPTTPAGIVALVVVAIIALVVFANISSRMDDVYPDLPPGEMIDGPVQDPLDGGIDAPPLP